MAASPILSEMCEMSQVRIEGGNPAFAQDPQSRPTTSGSSPSRPGTGDVHERYSITVWQAPNSRPGSRGTELKNAEEPYKPYLLASENLRSVCGPSFSGGNRCIIAVCWLPC